MIKKLQWKFIGIAMASLFCVLLIIVGTMNIVNYQSITEEADQTLRILSTNGGNFPLREDRPMPERPEKPMMSPELPFASRFFSVTFNQNEEIIATKTDNIAAIDEATARNMATKILHSGDQKGFSGNYRFCVIQETNGHILCIFLDCTNNLNTFHNFLLASCIISLAGLCAVFGLILIFSRRAVRPFSENYEKQKQFITDAGHEIKTPLTIIDADAEVLEMELPENEWIQDIRKQTKRLAALTNDLIYLSRLEETRSDFTRIDFPLSDVVTETVHTFQAPAKIQQKQITTQITPLISYCGDEKAIRQLLVILLDNALKYTPENGEIHVALGKQGKDIVCVVSNTVYFPVPHPEKLFDRFVRGDASRNSETGGYGIGLSIAKAIVSGHKGRICAYMKDTDSFGITIILPN